MHGVSKNSFNLSNVNKEIILYQSKIIIHERRKLSGKNLTNLNDYFLSTVTSIFIKVHLTDSL